jgi:hypothetical protein
MSHGARTQSIARLPLRMGSSPSLAALIEPRSLTLACTARERSALVTAVSASVITPTANCEKARTRWQCTAHEAVAFTTGGDPASVAHEL